jgi:hypothetical protein
MAFNPDEFLAGPTPKGSVTVSSFNPDEFLKPVSTTEQMVGLGSPVARFAKGFIADPLLGINQALGQAIGATGKSIESYTGPNAITQGMQQVGTGSNAVVNQYNQATQTARQRVGSDGIDFIELGGAVASPVNKLFGVTAAPTALGRIGQAAGQGTLFGSIQPVVGAKTEDDYITEKLKQMGAGALFGGLVSTGVETASKVGTIIKELAQPLSEKGRETVLRNYLDGLTGTKKEEIVAALKAPEELVKGVRPTAAEAVSNIPEATSLAAYQQKVASNPAKGVAGSFAAREAEQEAARVAALQSVGQNEAALQAAQAQRTAMTSPMREDALSQANIAGQVMPRLEDEIAAKFAQKTQAMQIGGKLGTTASQEANRLKTQNFYPVEGMPRVPSGYRPEEQYAQVQANLAGAKEAGAEATIKQAQKDFRQMQLDSLAQNGFYPLQSQPIISNIDNMLKSPGVGASGLVQSTLGELRDKLVSLTNPKTGVIDSRDLYTVRKEIGTTIAKNAKDTGNFDQNLIVKLDTNIKGYIDNAISTAGGATKEEIAKGQSNWNKYLTTYQQASDKINQMQIGQALEKKLGTSLGDKQRAGVFATAVENAAQTIKTSTGSSRYSKLEDVLTAPQIKAVNSVLADVQRKAQAEALAAKSGSAGVEIKGELPNFLSRTASITNTVLRVLKKDSNEQINRMAADLMLDPPKLAAFIEGVPTKQMPAIVEAFMTRLSPEMRGEFAMMVTAAKEGMNRNVPIRAATDISTQPNPITGQ